MPLECKDQISSAGRSITIKNMKIELENNPVDFHMCLLSNFTVTLKRERDYISLKKVLIVRIQHRDGLRFHLGTISFLFYNASNSLYKTNQSTPLRTHV
jgi:hypothetical protein